MHFALSSAVVAATFGCAAATIIEPLDKATVERDLMPRAASDSHFLTARDTSATFPLDWSVTNQTLFKGRVGTTIANVLLDVECLDCSTTGNVTASLTDHDIYKPHVKLDFEGVTGHFDMDVSATGLLIYTINLFTSESPFGFGYDGFDVGIQFFVDLVFSLSDKIDFQGGFDVTIPDGSYSEIDIFDDGNVVDNNFNGTTSTSLPIDVSVGNATFKADLRVRAQMGLEAKEFHTGAVAAIYANIGEFVAELTSSDTCQYEADEWFDINVGAYVSVGASSGWLTESYAPTASTTLFSSPTETQCLDNLLGATFTTPIIESTAAAAAAAANVVSPGDGPVETYTLTRCKVDVVNCPASMAEKVVATATAVPAEQKIAAMKAKKVTMVHVHDSKTVTLYQTAPVVETYSPKATS